MKKIARTRDDEPETHDVKTHDAKIHHAKNMTRDNDLTALIAAAVAARQTAYAPYSNHPVGAAVRTVDGRVFAGCNVENAAYPLGNCAEAGAVSAMVLAGARALDHVVVVGPTTGEACTPCGGCRQVLREFAVPGAGVTICGPDGTVLLRTTCGDLLPHSFGPANVGEVRGE
ncbi:cytidine deaminase [Eilatimonas milleporae]|uniref:Cytidine deaminase n=1 Tax=Eilatimonas milleporae TaxID=911205 RepID=A0A3M0DAA3_9PROT|nr:cytidine deaminase [Eilatimonas milleporae]RMB13063.1 cytidine deaminase [Eilatimonas milleporae]